MTDSGSVIVTGDRATLSGASLRPDVGWHCPGCGCCPADSGSACTEDLCPCTAGECRCWACIPADDGSRLDEEGTP